MRLFSYRFLIISFLAVSFSVSACAVRGPNQGDYNLMTVEQEAAWGARIKKEVDAQLRAKGQEFHDPEVVAYIDDLGRRLLTYAPEVRFDYTFDVVRTDTVNAFAVPGGHVYVNTGLIAMTENEAELAGVMAHEIGHVVARHSSERLSALLTASVVGDILVSTQRREIDRIVTSLAIQIATNTSGLAYSRANEEEADQIGVRMMHDAGFNPWAMQRFFQKLRDEHGEMSEVQVFFSTHPDPKDRRSKVRDYIQSIGPTDGLILDTERFQEVRARVLRLHPELAQQ